MTGRVIGEDLGSSSEREEMERANENAKFHSVLDDGELQTRTGTL